MVVTHPPAIPREHLRWHRCRRQAGHGVASGRASDSPYPAGTLALQRPAFARCGLDLGDCFNGTLNLLVPGGEWRLSEPALRINHLAWTPLHPPETFSFWPCLLRLPAPSGPDPAATTEQPLEQPVQQPVQQTLAGWIYWPHPETKLRHHQPAGQLEVLMPWIADLARLEARSGGLDLGVDGRRCRLIQPARLKARLLEFLKFRVLAAQESFFEAFAPPQAAAALRRWLAAVGWREALDLSDADLEAVLETARRLYLN
jgi:hypothetical protein